MPNKDFALRVHFIVLDLGYAFHWRMSAMAIQIVLKAMMNMRVPTEPFIVLNLNLSVK